jgi:multiple sugar transport system substrate-binding protein
MKDLIADAPKLKAAGSYVYADSGTGGWSILPFIWSGGGQITNAADTKATGYMNSKKTVAVVQEFTDLYKNGYLPKLIVGDTGGVSTSDGTAKGLYATELDGPWAFPTFASQYPNFKVGSAQVPAGSAGSISVVGGEDIVLTKSSKNKPAAEAFMKYMLSDSAQLAMAKVGQMPVLSSLSSKLTAINSYYAPFTEQLKTAEPRTVTPAWTQIDGILQDAVRSAMIGSQTPQAAMDAAAAQVDALLAKYSN